MAECPTDLCFAASLPRHPEPKLKISRLYTYLDSILKSGVSIDDEGENADDFIMYYYSLPKHKIIWFHLELNLPKLILTDLKALYDELISSRFTF